MTNQNHLKTKQNYLKKVENLFGYGRINNYGDKELKLKIFKLKLAYLSNFIDEKMFEQIFAHTFVTLANKLIDTTNKGKNQIIVNDIKKNKDKLYKKYDDEDDDDNYVIQPNDQPINLIEAINLILDFNKTVQLHGN